jgi:hypothetical protein
MESDTFILLEGGCPVCDADVEIIHIGGIAEEMESFTVPETATRNWWRDDWQGETVLGLEFKCLNGHKHWIEKNRFGDWN